MRTYDLHIRLSPQRNEVEFNRLQTFAAKLDYKGLVIDAPKSVAVKKTENLLEVFHRMTLSPRSAARLKFQVNKQCKQTDLFVIQGRSKPIWLAAAEIPNVHMVMLKDIEDFMVVDSQVARAMTKRNKPVEICLNKLLTISGSLRSRLMRVMSTALEHLVRAKCTLILTSGAHHLCELRSPKDLEALSFLASVPEEIAKNAMHQNPIALISHLQASKTTSKTEPVRREI